MRKPSLQSMAVGACLFLRDVEHAGFQVVSHESLKLFTMHVVDKGAPLYDYGN
jgi:hypothetical protein